MSEPRIRPRESQGTRRGANPDVVPRWLIGDGPERGRLEKVARTLGVADKVKFWGTLPREQVLEMLAECDVLVHPSLHDSGGWVCLEAMAAGRPVVCLDLGGPAVQVTEETGIKVPAISPEQAVRDLAAALSRLAADPALRAQMGEAGRRRVETHFTWDKKGEQLSEVYDAAREGSRRTLKPRDWHVTRV